MALYYMVNSFIYPNGVITALIHIFLVDTLPATLFLMSARLFIVIIQALIVTSALSHYHRYGRCGSLSEFPIRPFKVDYRVSC